jgi:uncharacterized oligopeptide transporter (OPT) family protein
VRAIADMVDVYAKAFTIGGKQGREGCLLSALADRLEALIAEGVGQ